MRLNDLTLQKAVDTTKAAEQTQQQVKLVSTGEDFVNTLREHDKKTAVEKVNNRERQDIETASKWIVHECGNCVTTNGIVQLSGKSVLTVKR